MVNVLHGVPVYLPAFAGTKLYSPITEVTRCNKVFMHWLTGSQSSSCHANVSVLDLLTASD